MQFRIIKKAEVIVLNVNKTLVKMNYSMLEITSLKNLNILVIDDDENTNYLTSYLFTNNYTDFCLSFELTAESALCKLKYTLENLPDIIFLDIDLPGMNGWQFLKEYQNNKFSTIKNIPIFMLTASVFNSDKVKSKTYSEVIDYIEKPFDEEKINVLKKYIIEN